MDLLESSKLKESVAYDGPGPTGDGSSSSVQKAKAGEKRKAGETKEPKEDAEKSADTKKKTARQRIPRAKKPKDMPKRPLSAYNLFFKSTRAKMMESTPVGSDGKAIPAGKIGFETLAKTIGREWKALSAKELDKYKAKAEEDMQRYKREMEDYHQNLAKKRRVTLPAAPNAEQGDKDPPMNENSIRGSSGGESAQNLASLSSAIGGSGEQLTQQSQESAFTARGGAPSNDNYGSIVEALAAARSQQTDQQALLQELANIRRQELFLQQAATVDPLANAMSQHSTAAGAGSLLYDQLLAHKLDMLRSQQALTSGFGQSQSQFPPSASALFGLQQHQAQHQQAPSFLEQLIMLQQHQNRRPTGLAGLHAESSSLLNAQAGVDHALEEAQQRRYAASLGATGEYLGTKEVAESLLEARNKAGRQQDKEDK